MKRWILAILGITAVIGLALYAFRPTPPAEDTAVEATSDQLSESPQPVQSVEPAARTTASPPAPSRKPVNPEQEPATTVVAVDTQPVDALPLNHAVDVLVSSQATYEQKQSTWKQLRDSGKLDPLIVELQRRAAEDPRTAAYPATLGQAYLQKCAVIKDVREQGILAMQADQVFDTALSLDPANWEARFTKAVALSYWPASMNKSQEVAEHFLMLVQQQETQAPQPQFAETYLLLGDQYKKAGQIEDARTAWQRGVSLYPEHEGLKSRLTATTAAAR